MTNAEKEAEKRAKAAVAWEAAKARVLAKERR